MLNNKHANTQRILARNEFASNDTWKTGLNNNDLIIGPTGSGKTRNYVKPNLMQCNESVVITDTKGSLVKEVGPLLKNHGYRVECMDFTAVGTGLGYNPLDFIRTDCEGNPNEQDIMSIASALCPIDALNEPFWDLSARMYINCLIGYVMEFLPDNEHTLEYVLKLASGLNDTTTQLMEEACEESPDCFTARRWKSFEALTKVDKTNGCILGFIAEKLDPLTFNGALSLYSKEQRVDFKSLGESKTALFLTVSDTDRTMDRLVSLFYTQALQQLCRYADEQCAGSALPVPVRFYLDDFATNCRIDDFDKIISVIRSRNISVSVILQSITQLETIYSHPASMTILNGCDHLIYLGGQDIETAQFVSAKADVMIGTVLHQPINHIWLFERGKRAKSVERYRIDEHELYRELPEAQALDIYGDEAMAETEIDLTFDNIPL